METDNAYYESRLLRKRDNMHVQIRQSNKKQLLAQKRKHLTKTLANIDLNLLDHIQKIEKLKQSQLETFNMFFEKLSSIGDNQQFFRKLAENKVYQRLIKLLFKEESIVTKTIIMEALANMSYYVKGLAQAYTWKQPKLNTFLIQEFKRYDFKQSKQHEYLKYVVILVCNLTIEGNPEYCQILIDCGFCNYLYARLTMFKDDPENPQYNLKYFLKKICQIRSHILKNVYNMRFVQESIDFLSLCYSEYSGLCAATFCFFLAEVINNCPKQRIRELEEIFGSRSVFQEIEFFFTETPQYDQPYVVDDKLITNLFYLLDVCISRFGFSIRGILEQVPRYILFDALFTQNQELFESAIYFFSTRFEHYFQHYSEMGPELEKLVNLCIDTVSNRPKYSEQAASVLQELAKNVYWPHGAITLINMGFLEKSLQWLQNGDNNRLKQAILLTIDMLLEDTQNEGNLGLILVTIQRCGLIEAIEKLQDSQCSELYKTSLSVISKIQMTLKKKEPDNN